MIRLLHAVATLVGVLDGSDQLLMSGTFTLGCLSLLTIITQFLRCYSPTLHVTTIKGGSCNQLTYLSIGPTHSAYTTLTK